MACCARCCRKVFRAEQKIAIGRVWHTFCFSCCVCQKLLDQCCFESDGHELYCHACYRQYCWKMPPECSEPCPVICADLDPTHPKKLVRVARTLPSPASTTSYHTRQKAEQNRRAKGTVQPKKRNSNYVYYDSCSANCTTGRVLTENKCYPTREYPPPIRATCQSPCQPRCRSASRLRCNPCCPTPPRCPKPTCCPKPICCLDPCCDPCKPLCCPIPKCCPKPICCPKPKCCPKPACCPKNACLKKSSCYLKPSCRSKSVCCLKPSCRSKSVRYVILPCCPDPCCQTCSPSCCPKPRCRPSPCASNTGCDFCPDIDSCILNALGSIL